MFLSCRRSLQLLSAPSYKRGAGASKKPTGGGPSSVEVAYAWHGDANIGAMRLTSFDVDTTAARTDSLAHAQQSMRVRTLQILWADADTVIGYMH